VELMLTALFPRVIDGFITAWGPLKRPSEGGIHISCLKAGLSNSQLFGRVLSISPALIFRSPKRLPNNKSV
jgi:hypothetical protein